MYIKYVDDPVKRRVNSAFGSLCDGDPIKNTLKLVDGCFSIFEREKLLASFCEFKHLSFPVDGFSLIDLSVCANSTETLFDNNLQSIAAVNGEYPLDADETYVRGILLAIIYPASNAIEATTYSSNLTIFDRPATGSFVLPVGEMFSHFANADADDARQLLNKVTITNPNADYSIRVKGLLISSKTNPDPNSFC
jgi:hypothetical protein